MTNQPNQINSLRFQDSTSQAHYYEADEYGDDDEYFNLLVTVEEISRLKQPVTIRFSFCERDMSRNDIPF
jgi:hypothetical protein